MPGLRHNPTYERHMTLADLAHCPRHGWYDRQVREQKMAEQVAGTSLVIGILAHVGLAELWRQRERGEKPWLISSAMDVMDKQPEAAAGALALLKDGPESYKTLKAGIMEYAAQWVGARDHWKPLAVAPETVPPPPWTVLNGMFVSYPDLIVDAGPMAPVLVVDHKTSAYRFDPAKWEFHPELLTQCLAAKQLMPGSPVYYQIDHLQRPSYKSSVWSFPATPVWEFTTFKEEVAKQWLEEGILRRDILLGRFGNAAFPFEVSACQTPYGLCAWWKTCFGGAVDG